MILELAFIELYKIFKKWRTYIGLFAIAFFVALMMYAVSVGGNYYLRNFYRMLEDQFIIVGNLLNGWYASFLLMQALIIHIPFFITLVGGDLFAGEGTAGTYRIILTRPISRDVFIISKFIAGYIYTLMLIIFFAIVSLVPSLIILGKGDLIIMIDKILIIQSNDVMWRFILAYASAFISMTTVLSLSILFSSMVNNAIGPIVGTMAVLIIFLSISELPFEIFESISPYLFTSYMATWLDYFDQPIDINNIIKSNLILVGHNCLFFFFTFFTFKKKDILT